MDWKNKPNQIFNKVKQQMYAKGIETFTYVDSFVSQYDPNQTKVLTSHFFNLFLNKVGVFLSTQQIRNIKDLYGKSKDEDAILYQDFFHDVKYSLSQKVVELINQAFQAIDKQQQKQICVKTLVSFYHSQNHPHVLTRRKSPEDVRNEFISAIQRKINQKNNITYAAFVDYYAELNFCIPNERLSFFQQLITGTWNLVKPEEYICPKRLQQIQFILYQKIRLKSDGKTNEWKTGKKAISYFDLNDCRYANFETFKRGLDKFGCNFKEHESKTLFDKYSVQGNLDYQQFVKQIMDLDINGMTSKQNLLQTKMGTNHFKVTH